MPTVAKSTPLIRNRRKTIILPAECGTAPVDITEQFLIYQPDSGDVIDNWDIKSDVDWCQASLVDQPRGRFLQCDFRCDERLLTKLSASGTATVHLELLSSSASVPAIVVEIVFVRETPFDVRVLSNNNAGNIQLYVRDSRSHADSGWDLAKVTSAASELDASVTPDPAGWRVSLSIHPQTTKLIPVHFVFHHDQHPALTTSTFVSTDIVSADEY